ncbi:ArsB/NhaD family transporter [Tsukamurella sp. 8F]|uniref:SLC13 family permease n=1 Tax=unclassified Tsukamurella TaxID=2633480 RepID=UPI0023B92557|nr:MULTISPECIES: SLC13 family permease [unclassified Tsukamurella]MDF0528328.1 ArsB/NhaD family transporter [Tsukamurella sp. 8J]MDF0586153.1 ArsB/NhaD family transporter [Tsukamurella sp. 8F]
MVSFAEQVGPVLAFLLAITVVAEIAHLAGVFEVAGYAAVRAGGGRVRLLWLLVVALACAATVLLSLDTTAVLLTPVVLAAARRVRAPALPFAMTTVWLANTASLLLPVSNLTNLLAVYHLPGVRAYIAVAWRPALVAVAVTVAVLFALHRRSLRGGYGPVAAPVIADRVLLWSAAGVCLALAPAFVSGVMPAIPAAVAAVVLVALVAWRDPAALRRLAVPWRMVLVLSAVFAAAQWLLSLGLDGAVRAAAGAGSSVADLLRLAGLGAAAANGVNNLPAYLALEPAAIGSPERLVALLIGVNLGPVVTLWASLATVLWRQRCARAGVPIRLWPFAWQGLLLACCVIPLAVLSL